MQEWTPEQKKAYNQQMKFRFKILVPIFVLGMLGMWSLDKAMEYDSLIHPYIDGIFLGVVAYVIINALVTKRIWFRKWELSSENAGYYFVLAFYILVFCVMLYFFIVLSKMLG